MTLFHSSVHINIQVIHHIHHIYHYFAYTAPGVTSSNIRWCSRYAGRLIADEDLGRLMRQWGSALARPLAAVAESDSPCSDPHTTKHRFPAPSSKLCQNWLCHSLSLWICPNYARIGYATEGALFISVNLSKLRQNWLCHSLSLWICPNSSRIGYATEGGSLSLWIRPNSARIGYDTEGALFISVNLSKLWQNWLCHSLSLWICPYSARIGYAPEGAFFLSVNLSIDAVSASWGIWILVRLWKHHNIKAHAHVNTRCVCPK